MAKDKKRESLKPIEGANRSLRHRPTLREEIVLALLPTVTVLIVFGFVEVFSQQRLLFASLASSAFLIYLDPQHGTNSIRTLVISQMSAAVVGLVIYTIFGPGYLSGASSMLITIVLMILLDAMHPPAVATSLSFAFRAGNENNLVLFTLALGMVAVLILLEKGMLRLLAYYTSRS